MYEQLIPVATSIDILRRMRGAILETKGKDYQIFSDAELLAFSTALYVLAEVVKMPVNKPDLPKKQNNFYQRYKDYPEVYTTKLSYTTPADRVKLYSELFRIDLWEEEFRGPNGVVANSRFSGSMDDFVSPRTVLFSPLSTDIVIAYVNKLYAETKFKKPAFQIIPTVIDEYETYALVPVSNRTEQKIKQAQFLGIFVESESMFGGNSRRLTSQALKTQYGKTLTSQI